MLAGFRTAARGWAHTISSPSQVQIDLWKGWPSPELLPPSHLRKASGAALSDPEIWEPGLSYGADDGYFPLRQELAKWLTSFYEPPQAIETERICITGGASQNLACLLQTFTDAIYTRNIWMVAPTYYLACRIFDDAGFAGKIRGVPEDEHGVDVGYLSQQLEKSEAKAREEHNVEAKLKPPRPWRKIYRHIIYAVPSFANPSSRIMSLDRRKSLVRLARQYDALIITDDVYDMLQWPSLHQSNTMALTKAYVLRVVDIDRFLDGGPNDDYGNAVSNGSFSKIIAPGCRTGWAEGMEKLAYGLSQTGSSRSGGCPSQITATFIHKMLASSTLQQHIFKVLQPAYSRRHHKMLQAIQHDLLPLGVTMPEIDRNVAGGYFIWITLPHGLSAEALAERALREESLTIAPGPLFQAQGDTSSEGMTFKSDVRLCFSYLEEDLLVEGVHRLAKVLRNVLQEEGIRM